jgi:hypothetical protein
MTMPTKAYNHSKHWRDRAAEMRALADCMEHGETIATMHRLADDYDKLADRAERRNAEPPNPQEKLPGPRPRPKPRRRNGSGYLESPY